MQHGMFASWHQNGIFNELCMHKNDELCDEYAKWDKDGILIRYGKYINGKFVSEDLI